MSKSNKLKEIKKSKWDIADIAQKTISAASSLVSALVLLRDKPRTLDWLAIGLSVTNVGITIHSEAKKYNKVDPYGFYDPEYHEMIAPAMRKIFVDLAENITVLTNIGSVDLISGEIDNITICWRKANNSLDFGPFFNKEDRDRIYNSIGEKMWESIGKKNATLTEDQMIGPIDENLGFEVQETSALLSLKKRATKFLDAGVTRSFLLEGEPGTGKTSAILYLINELGLTSFRTAVSELRGAAWQSENNVTKSLEGILMALKPDVLVLDDIDRGYLGQDGLLKLFEVARSHCRLIIATANNKKSIVGAMLRVGRFDDHIAFEGVDSEVIKSMLEEEDWELVPRMKTWPIAYIQNYIVSKKVLGRDVAVDEMKSIEERIKDIKDKSSKE